MRSLQLRSREAMAHDWLAREARTAPRSGSQATGRRATVVSCGWFQASCSSPATLGREQRARRPGATGESCLVAPPDGVLFTSGGYVALALARIFEHARLPQRSTASSVTRKLSNEGERRLYAA